MRTVEEQRAWERLGRRNKRQALEKINVGGEDHDFSSPCVVFGGPNGSGKSPMLRSIAETLGDRGLFLDLHHLAEQAMILLRSREDVEDLADEAGLFAPDDKRVEDLTRIVGREYSSVEWSQLDLLPAETEVAEIFKWGSDQATVPYFRVEHRGFTYSGREMGLGEFTMHLLMWILEQYRPVEDLTLLLDEPDAFLPPVGVERLLHRLLIICAERGWQLILSTHSEEMIRTAVRREAFVLLHVDVTGKTKAMPSRGNRNIAAPLLTKPSAEYVLFCEDESAFYLVQSMLRASDHLQPSTVAIAWGKGHGYMRSLRDALPKPARFGIRFVFVFDGDQWDSVQAQEGRWPSRFLPTEKDPDTLFRQALDLDVLSTRLGVSTATVESYLAAIEGYENHDWVNHLADHFGRPATLTALADAWVSQHAKYSAEFVKQMTSKQELLLHSTQLSLKEAREEATAREKYAVDPLDGDPSREPTPPGH